MAYDLIRCLTMQAGATLSGEGTAQIRTVSIPLEVVKIPNAQRKYSWAIKRPSTATSAGWSSTKTDMRDDLAKESESRGIVGTKPFRDQLSAVLNVADTLVRESGSSKPSLVVATRDAGAGWYYQIVDIRSESQT